MTNTAFPPLDISPELVEAAQTSKAWPFEEARKIVKRFQRDGYPEEVLFETGYGPSGLPHIGTFGEVARTTMVINAFRLLTEDKVTVRLICFSDDMDGMRKVPDNVPNKEMMEQHLGKPLTQVPTQMGRARRGATAPRYGRRTRYDRSTCYCVLEDTETMKNKEKLDLIEKICQHGAMSDDPGIAMFALALLRIIRQGRRPGDRSEGG